MPRNGSGVYSKPAGTTFVPNTVIESSKANLVLDDIATDLNVARPIVAGGTGATTAATARTSLGFSADAGNFGVKGADIASAGTTDLSTATGDYVTITGTTTITALGTSPAGTRRYVRFAGILTLTHNATSLILPGGASIITAAGDTAIFVSEGSGNWRCIDYVKASGPSPVRSVLRQIFTSSGTYTPTAGMVFCYIEAVGGGGGGGGTTASSASSQASAGGGGGGEYASKRATAADIGASKAVTIGAAGTGGAAGLNNGVVGGDTSVGTLCIAKGGSPGTGNNANSGSDGGNGGTGGTGDLLIPGEDGGDGGGGQILTMDTFSGKGGGSQLGRGAKSVRSSSAAGRAGKNYGGGGAGGMDRNAAAARGGGAGAPGIVIITEYIA